MATAKDKDKKNQVAKAGGTDVALPKFMQGHENRGTEKIGANDIEVPRIKLMQGTSPELDTYDFLKPGVWFHTSAEKDFGKELRITPLYMDVRYILWRPQSDGGGILARADDGLHWSPAHGTFEVELEEKYGGGTVKWTLKPTVPESGLDKWGSMNPANKDSPPAATKMYNIVCAFPDFPDLAPAVLTLQRSSIKVGRKFASKVKVSRFPLYGQIFTLGSESATNAKNQKFGMPTLIADGVIEDESLFKHYVEQHEYFKTANFSPADLEAMQSEDADDGEQGDDNDTSDNADRSQKGKGGGKGGARI
jgi:hypothetical protein